MNIEQLKVIFALDIKLVSTVGGMSDRSRLLSNDDVRWISQKHYDEFFRFLSTDQTENLEKLLKESGNGDVIKKMKRFRKSDSKMLFGRMEHSLICPN